MPPLTRMAFAAGIAAGGDRFVVLLEGPRQQGPAPMAVAMSATPGKRRLGPMG